MDLDKIAIVKCWRTRNEKKYERAFYGFFNSIFSSV